MTSVYTAGPDGSCTVCQRPAAEHAPEAWTADPRQCPPAERSDELEHQENLGMHLHAMSTPELVATSKRLSGECHAVMDAARSKETK